MCYYGAVKRLPPLIIVIVLDHKPATVIQASVEKHIVPYINHMSVSIPGYAICLAAHEVGLATCIKSPISKTVNALLGILDGDAVMFIGVGYASYVNSPPDRHPLASLVRRWEPTTNFVIKEG
jgi:nitroreductase